MSQNFYFILKLAAIIFVIGLLLFASIPWFLSSSIGKDLLLNMVNRKLPGEILIENVNLRWLGPQNIENVSLRDEFGKDVIHISHIESDAPLTSLIFHPFKAKNLRLTGLQGQIIQDDHGITNLESALGERKFTPERALTPVVIENVNIELRTQSDSSLAIKAVGLTKQDEIKGQLSLDGVIGSKTALNLKADRFPVLVLDQTLTISNPKLSGLLTNLLGDYLDISLDHQEINNLYSIKLFAKSPFLNAQLQGQISPEKVLFQEGSLLNFNLPAPQINRLLNILNIHALNFQKNFSGSADLKSVQLNFQDILQDLHGFAEFVINPTDIQLENDPNPFSLQAVTLLIDAIKKPSDIAIEMRGEGSQNNDPFNVAFEVNIDKKAILNRDLLALFQHGIPLQGQFQLFNYQGKGKGVVKEKDSSIHFSLDSPKFTIPEAELTIESLPIQDWINNTVLSEVEGVLSIHHPQIKDSDFAPLTFEEITLPLLVDFDDNLIKIGFNAKRNGGDDKIKGTLRIANWLKENRIKFDQANLQLNAELQNFQTDILQALFPDHPIRNVVGNNFDATIAAQHDALGQMNAHLILNTPRNAEAFLKYFETKLMMSDDYRDMTFEATTSQAIGSTQFMGTFQNLFDLKGNLQLDRAAVSLNGNLRHFPVGLMTKLVTGDVKFSEKMEAVLGSQVNAEVHADLKDRNGSIFANIKGLNGQLEFKGSVKEGNLYLKEPMTATLKVTPQLEHAVLREILPILGSVINSNEPIELKIAKEGFRLPLNSISLKKLDIGLGELHLNQMQFSRDGQLGQIVSLLGINANPFDVTFTPIYFSMENGTLNLQRADMLVAQEYPIASWGYIDFQNEQLNLAIGISGAALKRAFNARALKNTYMLIVPIRGATQRPQIDTAQVAARISTIVASTTVPKGRILGNIVQAASDLLTKDNVPSPSTIPLPWQNLYEDHETSLSDTSQPLEKPIDELKKGAKSIIKGIFGK